MLFPGIRSVVSGSTYALSSDEDVIALTRMTESRIESSMLVVWLLVVLVLM